MVWEYLIFVPIFISKMGDQLNQLAGQVERVLAEPERDELADSSQNIFQQKKLPGVSRRTGLIPANPQRL